jgi:hypothetical protein
MDTGNNGQLLQMTPEAIAEVKVLTAGYQAEYGRSSGLQITAVTKSGTNQYHGSVYDVMRNSDWNENSWVNKINGTPKAVDKQSDWGYTFGGRRQSPAAPTSSSSSIRRNTGHGTPPYAAPVPRPDQAERAGDFRLRSTTTGPSRP